MQQQHQVLRGEVVQPCLGCVARLQLLAGQVEQPLLPIQAGQVAVALVLHGAMAEQVAMVAGHQQMVQAAAVDGVATEERLHLHLRQAEQVEVDYSMVGMCS